MSNITDEFIIETFYENDKYLYRKLRNASDDIKEYLNNRFDDYDSLTEVIYRIKNKIYERPVCLTCGRRLKFKVNHFPIYCSCKCRANSNESREKMKKTKLERYGDENYSNREQAVKHTDYESLHNKRRKTNLLRYGHEFYLASDEGKRKTKETLKRKYDVTNISQIEEIKRKKIKTCHEHFYVDYGFVIEQSFNNMRKTYERNKEEIVRKIKKTKLERYNNENYSNIKTAQKTKLKRYGITSPFQDPEKQRECQKLAHTEEANRKTIMTCLRKYFSRSWQESDMGKLTLSNILSSKEVQRQIYETKKRNHTFNSSSTEKKTYNILKSRFPDVIDQHRTDKYPFNCDFYIPSHDLYIECQYHWTHGKHPYDKGNEEDSKLVELWESKNTKFYDNAIKTWTVRDVKKRTIAHVNNLNYIELFSFDEFLEWYENFS